MAVSAWRSLEPSAVRREGATSADRSGARSRGPRWPFADGALSGGTRVERPRPLGIAEAHTVLGQPSEMSPVERWALARREEVLQPLPKLGFKRFPIRGHREGVGQHEGVVQEFGLQHRRRADDLSSGGPIARTESGSPRVRAPIRISSTAQTGRSSTSEVRATMSRLNATAASSPRATRTKERPGRRRQPGPPKRSPVALGVRRRPQAPR